MRGSEKKREGTRRQGKKERKGKNKTVFTFTIITTTTFTSILLPLRITYYRNVGELKQKERKWYFNNLYCKTFNKNIYFFKHDTTLVPNGVRPLQTTKTIELSRERKETKKKEGWK